MPCLPALLFVVACAGFADADSVTRHDLDDLLDSTVHGWRFRLGECPGAEKAGFDDSTWEQVDVGHQWWPHDSVCWYRAQLRIPEKINGVSAAGATVRMKVAVDNEADAYVNGEFRQHFTRAGGDFIVAENAHSGDVVTVALHGINRPGYGSLYQAYLVSSEAEEMVEALRALVADYDKLESYIAFGPVNGARHWKRLMNRSVRALDMKACRAGEARQFLNSVEKARTALLSDQENLNDNLERIATKLNNLRSLIAKGQAEGLPMDYERVDARVVESFMQYAKDDLADGQTGHAFRALYTVPFLESMAEESMRTAHKALRSPSSALRPPRYTTGPVGVRDGTFWQEETPMFFTGVGHFDQVRKDVPILTEYGLNIIQIEIGPKIVVTGPDTVDERPIRDDTLATLDNAAKYNVMVNLLISPHYFPQWMLDQYPELSKCGFGFMGHCIDAPESRTVYELYLRTLMSLIAKHPALHSITLSNEPQYVGRCEHAREAFHTWLEAEHGSIEECNRIWGTAFVAFEDVPLPENVNSNYALYYDFCRFSQDHFLEFHHFLAGLIHDYDPGLPVHAKTMSHAFGDTGKFEVGVDYEEFSKIGTVAGNDCVQTFEGELGKEYLQRWQDMAMNYTFQRSVAPNSPIFNSEDHIISDGDTRFIPASHIRTAYWTQALHGQGAATTWVWERGQQGDLAENILTRVECVRALGRIGLDLNRLGKEMVALQQIEPEVAILYSFSSMLPSNDFADEATAAFEGMHFSDAPCGFVTERQATAGKLKDHKLVIAPNTSHVSADVVTSLQDYLDSGGTLAAVGDCFSHDEYGHVQNDDLHCSDAGRFILHPERMSGHGYRDILDPLLDKTGCARPVRIEGKNGEPVWGVNVRTVSCNGQRLVSLVNFGKGPQQIVVKTYGKRIGGAFDLLAYKRVSLPLRLAPLDPVLLAFPE